MHPKPVLTRKNPRKECRGAAVGRESGWPAAWTGVKSVVHRVCPGWESEPVIDGRPFVFLKL